MFVLGLIGKESVYVPYIGPLPYSFWRERTDSFIHRTVLDILAIYMPFDWGILTENGFLRLIRHSAIYSYPSTYLLHSWSEHLSIE